MAAHPTPAVPAPTRTSTMGGHVTGAEVAVLLAEVQALPNPSAASVMAGAGIPLFPCIPGGKTPLTRHGFLDATTDLRTVSLWWGRWPDANLGMPTGPTSGIDVVDVDRRSSGDGHEMFRRVSQRVAADGWMLQITTPSGGTHFYYPADPARPQASWACGSAHVDFRGAGGYVIVPPSTITTPEGRAFYRVVAAGEDSHSVNAQRLREAVDHGIVRRRLDARVGRQPATVDVSRLAQWVGQRPEGERNSGLFWAACRLVEAGHDRNATLSALAGAAQSVGLLDREIHATVTSAYRHAHPEPRQLSNPTPSQATVPVVEAVML